MNENGLSTGDLYALTNGNNNNTLNNPMWLLWALLFGNGFGGFGGNRNGVENIQITDRLNNLQSQIASNQQTNTISGAIAGNHEQLHGISAGVNMGFAGVNANIADTRSAMQNCCCDIKTNILNQTNQLQAQIAQLANGVQTGFANIGFLTQQQTNELNNTANANTQRILDKMCNDTTQALRDKLWEASQNAQTASIVAQLKTT